VSKISTSDSLKNEFVFSKASDIGGENYVYWRHRFRKGQESPGYRYQGDSQYRNKKGQFENEQGAALAGGNFDRGGTARIVAFN
jgi:hypothetical protein